MGLDRLNMKLINDRLSYKSGRIFTGKGHSLLLITYDRLFET